MIKVYLALTLEEAEYQFEELREKWGQRHPCNHWIMGNYPEQRTGRITMEYLFGKNPVLEALRAGRPINKILVARGSNKAFLREITAQAKNSNILLQEVDKKQLDALAGGDNHQGLLAQVAAKEYDDWEEILAQTKEKGEMPLFVLLDGVEDPHNLGAILRTADAAGVHCVVIPKHRAVPLTAGVAKASAGAVEYVPVARVTNLAQSIEKMKEAGLWVVGADAEASRAYFETDLKGPLALIVGGENKGIGKLVKDKCDLLVRIPMSGSVNSLNVSVAASVVLYDILRQRTRG